jgi:hypothetical protein
MSQQEIGSFDRNKKSPSCYADSGSTRAQFLRDLRIRLDHWSAEVVIVTIATSAMKRQFPREAVRSPLEALKGEPNDLSQREIIQPDRRL